MDPGDGRTAASVVTPLQQLFNALMYIWGVLTGTIAKNITHLNEATGTALTVLGFSYFSRLMVVDAPLTVNDVTTLNAQVNATANVNAASLTTASATIASLAVTGSGNVSGTLAAGFVNTNGANVAGQLVAARFRDASTATITGTDSNMTIDAGIVRTVIIPDGTLSALRTYTIVGGADGEEIELVTGNNAFAISVGPISPTVGTAATWYLTRYTVGGTGYLKLRKVGSVWIRMVAVNI